MTPAPCPECAALRARVAELEAQHDAAGDMFASGRRYERTWYGLRAAELEQVVIGQRDVLLAMKAERDRAIAALEADRERARKELAEIDRLEDECSGLRAGVDVLAAERDQLRAVVERVRDVLGRADDYEYVYEMAEALEDALPAPPPADDGRPL